ATDSRADAQVRRPIDGSGRRRARPRGRTRGCSKNLHRRQEGLSRVQDPRQSTIRSDSLECPTMPPPHDTTFNAETAELAEQNRFSAGSASSALIVVATFRAFRV